MLLRGRSKESKDRTRKVTPPGPVYMSNEQFADYLSDLRNNRVARPSGARPQPSSSRRESGRGLSTTAQTDQPSASPPPESAPRSGSSLSHRRAQSSLSTYSSVNSRTGRSLVQQPYSGVTGRDCSQGAPIVPLKPSEVVPSATYIERGQRWMEKEEAVALREAMEDMDLKQEEEEEIRVHEAAQNEASELVWQHQHPEELVKPDAPYRYKDHLRKNSYAHARTQSVGRYGGIGMVTGLARDMAPRSVSGGSSSSGGMYSPRSRVSSDSSRHSNLDRNISPETVTRHSIDSVTEAPTTTTTGKSYGNILGARPEGTSRRRSSAKRNISGEIAGTFTGEQIWEEPEQESLDRGRSTETRDIPAPLRIKPRNPLNRVQFAQDLTPRSNSTPPEPIKRLSTSEIHRNPPSQSRNPAYTSNPLPTMTSDQDPAPEKPPVPEKSTKDGLEIRSEDIRQATSMRLKDRSPKLPTPTVVSDRPGRPIVSFDKNWKPREADLKPEERRQPKLFGSRSSDCQRQGIPARPDSKDISTSIPTINFPDAPSIEVKAVPAISIPTMNFPDPTPSVPTINVPDASMISVSASDAPTINVRASDISNGRRALPDPKTTAARPPPRHHATAPAARGYWSPAGKRATATCHQCQLPIEGRVVAVRGATERYHPQCFICFTCGTGLEALEISPEPPVKRAERLDRIQRRSRGEQLPEIEGQTMAEDGDERLRHYCHLDWHEAFAPRCKHCKTPIIGEHTVALGEHWHFGHFFCAECGDPFEKGMSHIEKDGYAWCLNCQTKRTERRAPKCLKCKQPVIGEYVQAMGGEWHDRCFLCATCLGGFDDGSFFPRETGGETVVVCTKCMEKELKA